jgi:hypothetical protein
LVVLAFLLLITITTALDFTYATRVFDSDIYTISGFYPNLKSRYSLLVSSNTGTIQKLHLDTYHYSTLVIPEARRMGAAFIDSTTDLFYVFVQYTSVKLYTIQISNMTIIDSYVIPNISTVPHCSTFIPGTNNAVFSVWYAATRYVNLKTKQVAQLDVNGAAGPFSCVTAGSVGIFTAIDQNSVKFVHVALHFDPPQIQRQPSDIRFSCLTCVSRVTIAGSDVNLFMVPQIYPGQTSLREIHKLEALERPEILSFNATDDMTGILFDPETKEAFFFSNQNTYLKPDDQFQSINRFDIITHGERLLLQGTGFIDRTNNNPVGYAVDKYGDIYKLLQKAPVTTAPPTTSGTPETEPPNSPSLWQSIIQLLSRMTRRRWN